MDKRIIAGISLIIPLLLLYLVYTGSINIFEFILGTITALIVGLLFGEAIIEKPSKLYNPLRWLWALVYMLLYFTIIEFRAHLHVLKLIIQPSKVNPGIVRVPYGVETDYAITTIANSITNTPGTVVVDIDPDKKVFYVHWINIRALEPEKTREYVSKSFEEYAGKIFD